MPIDLTKLQASVDANLASVTDEDTVIDGAVAAITGIGQQIKDAVAADNSISQANTDAVAAIVDQIVARNTAQKDKLAAALLQNTPQQP